MTRIGPSLLSETDRHTLAACERHPGELRAFLKEHADRHEKLFDTGAPVTQLVHARAEIIDALLQHLWQQFGLHNNHEIALMAVGGYGRAELHPHSDIDLLIVHHKCELPLDVLEQFVALLWDLRLTIGHSVRSLEECAIVARDDLTIMTNLMDARLLCGDPVMLVLLQKQLSPVLMWPADAFFRGKRDEQYARHRKFEGTAYKLEPNLKSSPGGLRDIQNIYWCAKRRFGESSLQAFTRRGVLLPSEYRAITRCLHFLWRVRYALHCVAARAEDRLLFDLQIQVAERLGFSDAPGKRAVEQFMKQYFRAVLTVRNLNELLIQLFDEVLIGHHGEIAPEKIDDWFQHRQGRIELIDKHTFKNHPEAMLKIFVRIAENAHLNGINAQTLRQLRENRSRIDNVFRANPRHQQLFVRLLRARENLAVALFLIKETGVLGAFVPDYAAITGQMQFDRFHHYTVDEHTLFLLRNIVRLSESKQAGLFPHAEQIMQRQVAPEIMYLAGLYHDIGKGRGGDHAELGAVDALAFCREIGLSDDDAELVAWLVQKHLAMSHVAQRKDINDPDVIAEFAELVGSEQRLELLYVLTMCDIRATNASLWNSWKDALLRDLYLATADFLRRGTTLSSADMAQRTREAALLRLQEQGFGAQAVHDLWRTLGADYFTKVNAEQLVWVTTTLLHQHNPDDVLVASRQNHEMGGTEILVYVNDQDYLFAAITALLAQKKVSILSATIHTTPYGKGLDSFLVMEETGVPVTDAPRLQSIQRHIAQHLRDAAKVVLNLSQTQHRRQPFELPTQIAIHNDDRKQRSRLELITLDRPGLLARVGAAFKYCDIVLHNAKIVTLGERAEDVFFISNHELHALNNEQQQQLIHRLNSLLETPASTKRH